MKFALLAVLSIALLSSNASAQDEQRLSQCPGGFKKFYSGFASAVRSGNAAKVASMTRFPLVWGLDAGDEGKYTRPQFLKNYARLFGDNTTDFMKESDPLCSVADDGTVMVTSEDALTLNFKKYASVFKLTAYVVEP